MSSFTQLVNERRSANNFLTGHEITEGELNEIFDLVKLAPSAYNLQHAHYLVVFDKEKKEQLYKASNNQYKVLSSSAVVIVLGDKKAYQKAGVIYKGLHILGMVTEQEYEHMVRNAISFYETRGEEFEKEDAIRNASLSAMLFMLALKDKGWDSCPMIGFDKEAVKELLNIDDRYELVMMITIGKEKVESRRPRGYRKPLSEFVTYIK